MDKRIRESIEACRPASEDLHSPEMADVARRLQDDPHARQVYDRVQEYDAAILKAIDDVSVPPGLSERILERLRAAGDESVKGRSHELLAGIVAAASKTHEANPQAQVSPAPRRLALSRRRLMGTALTALLACVLLVVVINLLQQPSDLDLPELADQWQAQLGNDWQKTAAAPPDFAVPGAVLVKPTGWQWVDRYATVPVVAYELVHAKAGKAMLYVAQMTRDGLRGSPPLTPQSTSGQAVAYWRSGSHVYVLVVEDERNYRAFVRPSTTPFA
jgi:hypothetical protein